MALTYKSDRLQAKFFLLFVISLSKSYCYQERSLDQQSDPYCLNWDVQNSNICLQCDSSQNAYPALLNPNLIICAVPTQLEDGQPCIIDNSTLNLYDLQTGIELFVSIRQIENYTEAYCQVKNFVNYSCLKYKQIEPTQIQVFSKWSPYKYFNFTKIRDALVQTSVDYYCSQCPSGYNQYLGVIPSLQVYYFGCSVNQQCDTFSYFDSLKNECAQCNELFENCLSCNSTQCLICPKGYYFNPSVYDYSTQAYQGKCIFQTCPEGYCINEFGYQCVNSQLDNCLKCQQIGSYQRCSLCKPGFYTLQDDNECLQQSLILDSRPRFVRAPDYNEYLLSQSLNSNDGLAFSNPAFSITKVLNDIYQSIANGTYSGANLVIYLLNGDHFLFTCTGDQRESLLFKIYLELRNFCEDLNLYRMELPSDQLNITIQPLDCNLKSQLGLIGDSMFLTYCTSDKLNVYVSSSYSYFNITGNWTFINLNFNGENSLAHDPSLRYFLYLIPVQLCTIEGDVSGRDGILQTLQNTDVNVSYSCDDSYQVSPNPEDVQYKCKTNQGVILNQAKESSLRCGKKYDDSNYFFMNKYGVYSKRQKTLFNLYAFADYRSVNQTVPSLNIINCTFKYFYTDFDSLINIEQGSLSRTIYNNNYFYFYDGQLFGGNISLQGISVSSSRFCRGLIFYRKLTYGIEASMSLINNTLIYSSNPNSAPLKGQVYVNNCTFTALNSYKDVKALANSAQPVYSRLDSNIYEPIRLLEPIHQGIVLNLEDYPGAVIFINSLVTNNFHYISEFNNTITYPEERVKNIDFRQTFSDGNSEYKLGLCTSQGDSRYLFGHGFYLDEQEDIDQYYDVFERLSTIYLSRTSGLIYFQNNTCQYQIGTFGGCISINTPQSGYQSNSYVVINNNTFNNNMAYLSGNAIFIRVAINETQPSDICGGGIEISNNIMKQNIGTKISNGGAVSVICTYLTYKDLVEKSSALTIQNITSESSQDSIIYNFSTTFINFTINTTTLKISSNTFMQNHAGNNGTALNLFNLPIITTANNFYTYNSDVNVYFEQLYSPYYNNLTNNQPFSFYDRIYNFTDQYDFMLFKDYTADIPPSMLEFKNRAQLQYSKVRGALYIRYCQTKYCLENIQTSFIDTQSVFKMQDSGLLLKDNFNSDLASCIYIVGGMNMLFIQNLFYNNSNSKILSPDLINKLKDTNSQILDVSQLVQSSMVVINIESPKLDNQLKQQVTFLKAIFKSNKNYQFVDLGYNQNQDAFQYRGQLIRMVSNYKNLSDNFIPALYLNQSDVFNNTFYGNYSSQFYIESSVFTIADSVFYMCGSLESASKYQQYGLIWVNSKFSFNYYPDNPIQIFNNILIGFFSEGKGLVYLQIARQFVFIQNNTLQGFIMKSQGTLVYLEEIEEYPYNYICMQNNIMGGNLGSVFSNNVRVNQPQTSVFLNYNEYYQNHQSDSKATIYNIQGLWMVINLVTYIQYDWQYTVTFNYKYFCVFITEIMNAREQSSSPCSYFIGEEVWEEVNRFDILESTLYFKDFNNFYQHDTLKYFDTEPAFQVQVNRDATWFEEEGFIIPLNSSLVLINYATFVITPYKKTGLTLGILESVNSNVSIIYLSQSNYYFELISTVIQDKYWITITQNSYFTIKTFMVLQNQGFGDSGIIFCQQSFCNISQGYFHANYFTQLITVSQAIFVYINQIQTEINIVEKSIFNISNSPVQLYQFNSYGDFSQLSIFVLNNSTSSFEQLIFQNFSSYQLMTIAFSQVYFNNATIQMINFNSQNSSIIKGLFWVSSSSLYFNETIFQYIDGYPNGVIKVLRGSSLYVTQCTFTDIRGGSSYYLFQIQQADYVVFSQNYFGNANQRIFYVQNSTLDINNCTFEQITQEVVDGYYAVLTILYSHFNSIQQNPQYSYGAINCNCFYAQIVGNYFQNMQAQNGSAIYLIQHVNSTTYLRSNLISISRNTFMNNSAQSGGSIYINGLYQAEIINNHFKYNNASLSGGSIYAQCMNIQEDYTLNCTLTLKNNLFELNRADLQGGVIFWASNGSINYQQNVFRNNTSPYGSIIATYPISYQIYTSNSSEQNLVQYQSDQAYLFITPGQVLHLQVVLYDSFGQVVSSDSSSKLLLYNPSNSVIMTNNYEYAVNGTYTFNSLQISGNQNAYVDIELHFIGLQDYGNILDIVQNLPVIKVESGNCQVGQIISSEGVCIYCQTQYYSMIVPDHNTTCLKCPQGGYCINGTQIYPLDGYQRAQNQFDRFILCPFNNSCLAGGDILINGSCSSGYTSIMCSKCSSGYYLTNFESSQCTKCNSFVTNIVIILLVATLFISVVYLKMIAKFSDNENINQILGQYGKLLITHIQLINIVYDIDQNLNGKYNVVINEFLSYLSLNVFSNNLDCLFQHLNLNSIISLSIIMLITYSLLLPIAILLSIIILKTINRKKQFDFSSLKAKWVTLLSPIIIQKALMFSVCIDIDGVMKLKQDTNLECYTGQHLKYFIGLALPILLIMIITQFVLPILKLKLFIKFQEGSKIGQILNRILFLQANKIPEEFKFENNQVYKRRYYYWDMIIQLRLLTLVFLMALMNTQKIEIQLLVLQIILCLFLDLHLRLNPYKNQKLNLFETKAQIMLMITLYLKLFVQSNSHYNTYYSESFQIICMLVIFVSVSSFFVYWFVQLRIDLIKELVRIKNYKLIEYLTCRPYNPNKIFDGFLSEGKQFKLIYANGFTEIVSTQGSNMSNLGLVSSTDVARFQSIKNIQIPQPVSQKLVSMKQIKRNKLNLKLDTTELF